MDDYDNFVAEYEQSNKDALEMLTEALGTQNEAEIAAAWELYDETSKELEVAQQLAKDEWGWEETRSSSEEEEWAKEDQEKNIFFSTDPSENPGAEPRGEPFMFREDAINYVADIAGYAQGYFGIFESEAGGFEVWYSPEG